VGTAFPHAPLDPETADQRILDPLLHVWFRCLQALELLGYNRVGDNTYPNVMALLTGKPAEERPFGWIDRAPFLWKDFSAAGYRTLLVEDSFIRNHVFNIWVDPLNSPGGFNSVPVDYYFRPLSVAMHADHGLLDWRPKEYRLCTGPVLEDELILNWVSSCCLYLLFYLA